MFDLPDVRGVVTAALAEDLGVAPAALAGREARSDLLRRDVTTSAVLAPGARFEGAIVARESGVVCGLPVADAVFGTLARAVGEPDAVEVFPLVAEGADVDAGARLAEVAGDAHIVLAAERSALDLMMTLAGIATAARRWQAAAGERLTIVDTRKTWPGLRALSKYAVAVGGAQNHRRGLWDMVLVKDNHLTGTDVASAVEAAKAAHPDLLVQVEADDVDAARAAARAGADAVLLDNMDDVALAEAVVAVREEAQAHGRECLTEASGGIEIGRLAALAEAGVDRVSTSRITLAPPFDAGLDGAVVP